MRQFLLIPALICCVAPFVTQAADSPDCDRTCLEGFVDQYVAALRTREVAKLAVAPQVKYTENTARLELGDGLWRTITSVEPYRVVAADPQSGQVVYFGAITENGRPNMLGVRLKVVGRRVTEIEALVSRTNPLFDRSNLEVPRPELQQVLAASERSTREQMIRTANSYFDGIVARTDAGVPFADECSRVENGVLTAATSVPAGLKASPGVELLGCAMQFRLGTSQIDSVQPRRFEVVDVERGLVVGVFSLNLSASRTQIKRTDGSVRPVADWALYPTTGPVMEMFKVRNGKLHEIEVVMMPLLPFRISTGW